MAGEVGNDITIDAPQHTGVGRGSVAAIELKRAAPDGYTLMCTISTTMIMNKVRYKNLQYDPDKDFDLVAYARKEKTNVGTYGAGSFAHMCIAEVNKFYGLQIEAVHYRGEAPMWTDLATGSIQGAIGGAVPALNLIDSGKGEAVAMLSKKRLQKMLTWRPSRSSARTPDSSA